MNLRKAFSLTAAAGLVAASAIVAAPQFASAGNCTDPDRWTGGHYNASSQGYETVWGTYYNVCGGTVNVKMRVGYGTDSGCVPVASGSSRTIKVTRAIPYPSFDPYFDGFIVNC